MKIIGLMSGTSVDGIDAVIVDIQNGVEDHDAVRVNVLQFATYPYPDGVRERILEISAPGAGSVEKICHLNAYLGELFAQAAIRIAREAGVELASIDAIGSHGQTIQHLPQPQDESGILVRSTLQIGEPSIIAERTGVTTVADFRPRDMAAGGQGAPLAPYGHYLLFRHPTRTRIVTNIGGISNLTYLPAGATPDQVIAFDTGPGNMLIDGLMREISGGTRVYDENGDDAAQGTCDADLLRSLMTHPYFTSKPPKSTGREEFGAAYLRQIHKEAGSCGINNADLLRTLTEYTAESIVYSFKTFLPNMRDMLETQTIDLLFCGGGVRNQTLMRAVQQRVQPLSIASVEQVGVSSDALEAIVFALFARETLAGRPANLPNVTGSAHPVILGKIIPGRSFRSLGGVSQT
ncbi:anhydro-N-acetylmuramic acid kinase [Candidatus Moduliflexus flocculans]|uniref:Anhydro-N-acetylmuramic acid kinase n=1 Tax=Candidatus Moduliflexus flocculans TaxID=1499966 RepID=A0A0S6W4V6_9BACT|nr:anhydro-N-acetylmuramic acid kinase [Candidatus Moduliflexus flocculans]